MRPQDQTKAKAPYQPAAEDKNRKDTDKNRDAGKMSDKDKNSGSCGTSKGSCGTK
jgi:hypothetical protein